MANLINGLGGSAGFDENSFGPSDDGSVADLDLSLLFPNGLNFFGTVLDLTDANINNNGNLTFNAAFSTFTPEAITGNFGNPIFAPYFADVETTGGGAAATPGGTSTGSNLVHYDLDMTNQIFTVTWDDVGYYESHTDLLNAFQLRLIAKNGPGFAPGDFDIEFRYETINWTTGDASGGSGGLGGTTARAGYSVSDGVNFFELPQSGVQADMLDLENLSNVGEPGVFRFGVRNGASDQSVAEGAPAAGAVAQVPIRLSFPSANPVEVSYQTVAGTAGSGADFISAMGSVTFAPGETEKLVPIQLVGDGVPPPQGSPGHR